MTANMFVRKRAGLRGDGLRQAAALTKPASPRQDLASASRRGTSRVREAAAAVLSARRGGRRRPDGKRRKGSVRVGVGRGDGEGEGDGVGVTVGEGMGRGVKVGSVAVGEGVGLGDGSPAGTKARIAPARIAASTPRTMASASTVPQSVGRRTTR